jgi:23S rRNA pseudouridine2605 synthase
VPGNRGSIKTTNTMHIQGLLGMWVVAIRASIQLGAVSMEERLHKIIASAGLASRRAAEQLILDGAVTVDGKVTRELGVRIDPALHHIKVRGKLINPRLASQKKTYILLDKPRGYVSSVSDPQRRPVVMDLVQGRHAGLHLVGRLDFNTEGLLILTNDGEFTELLTRAGKVPKVYQVKVKGSPSPDQIQQLRRGVRLGPIKTAPAEIKLVERTREAGNTWYEVTLREGRNQQIRKMFQSIGHTVTKLRRVKIGHVSDKGLRPGMSRDLTPSEVKRFLNDYGKQ